MTGNRTEVAIYNYSKHPSLIAEERDKDAIPNTHSAWYYFQNTNIHRTQLTPLI